MSNAIITQVIAPWLRGAAASRTYRWNALAVAVLMYYAQAHGIPLTPEATAVAVSIGFGVMNAALRVITKKPLNKRGAPGAEALPAPEAERPTTAMFDAFMEAVRRDPERSLELLEALRVAQGKLRGKKTEGQKK